MDAGSGSGLFSLSARRLGAEYVHSFDYDRDSVETTRRLKNRFRPDDDAWTIERADVLDEEYLRQLGEFDIVYSWGVLHHTGALDEAMDNVLIPLAPGGRLAIGIYNYHPHLTEWYRFLKRKYVESSWAGKAVIGGGYVSYKFARGLLADIVRGRSPFRRYSEYKQNRGMAMWNDWIDWIGGFPYEAARMEDIFEFYKERNLELETLSDAVGSLGINEFVFRAPE